MKILAVADSIFRRRAAAHESWFPEPTPLWVYPDDERWQESHLWDSMGENGGHHGPYRGPTILHHPDLQYALDNGWRVVGGNKSIDHQSRGETTSGHAYLYKIGPDGLIHTVHLGMGPEEAHSAAYEADEDLERPGGFNDVYGSVPERNWRHLIMAEGGSHEKPDGEHQKLKDLVDDEAVRSADPKHKGYDDFELMPGYRDLRIPGVDENWEKRHQYSYRRAWETGTNNPHLHFDDPIPDPYADIDKIPRNLKRGPEPLEDFGDFGGVRHPRYGSEESRSGTGLPRGSFSP